MTSPIGTSIKRREDERLVTGRGRYLDDLRLPGILHAAIVRSPHAHARVTRIDGAFNFPDLEARGHNVLDPQYSIRFDATELWGVGATDGSTVNVDLCERYLEPA